MTRGILVLNAGSSSIKFALYPAVPGPDEDAAAYHGEIEGIGHALHLLVRDAGRRSLADAAIAGPATHHRGSPRCWNGFPRIPKARKSSQSATASCTAGAPMP